MLLVRCLLVSGFVIGFLGVSPAVADWPNAVAKWDQLSQGVDTWGAASWVLPEGSALTADDFLCTSLQPISEIRFGGFLNGGPINQFRITFWTDVVRTLDDESHPGSLIYDQLIAPASQADPLKLGWQDMGDGTWLINLPEDQWFRQQGSQQVPVVYWIGIQAVADAGNFYWNFRDRNLDGWGDDAAFQSDEFGILPWSSWGWTVADPGTGPDLYDGLLPQDFWKSADMAFTVSTPEPATIALLAVGGLVAPLLRRNRKA